MELGTRSIRSAGAGSGSIEVTLPGALRPLTGLRCRIALRDGLRPEIVLQPDLATARDAFARLWTLIAGAAGAEDAGALAFADLPLTLHPAPSGPAARLAWTDGLALALPPPHPPEVLARAIRGLGAVLAGRIGIAPCHGAGFGASAAQAMTGLVADPSDQAACDIAAAALSDLGIAAAPVPPAGDAFAPDRWAAAAPRLRAIAELHQDWSVDPDRHAAVRAAWRRGVTLELSGD